MKKNFDYWFWMIVCFIPMLVFKIVIDIGIYLLDFWKLMEECHYRAK